MFPHAKIMPRAPGRFAGLGREANSSKWAPTPNPGDRDRQLPSDGRPWNRGEQNPSRCPFVNTSARISHPHSLALSTSPQRNATDDRRTTVPPQAPSRAHAHRWVDTPSSSGSSVGPCLRASSQIQERLCASAIVDSVA
jgi:hypothetical protein